MGKVHRLFTLRHGVVQHPLQSLSNVKIKQNEDKRQKENFIFSLMQMQKKAEGLTWVRGLGDGVGALAFQGTVGLSCSKAQC